MSNIPEIEAALRQLPVGEQWEVARWLLERLEQTPAPATGEQNGSPVAQPDYSARRRRIFGDKVIPNMVLAARSEERW